MQDNPVKNKILELYEQSINHDGYSGFSVTIKILKRNQKEVIIDAGLQYRFVIGEVTNYKGVKSKEYKGIALKEYKGVESKESI